MIKWYDISCATLYILTTLKQPVMTAKFIYFLIKKKDREKKATVLQQLIQQQVVNGELERL